MYSWLLPPSVLINSSPDPPFVSCFFSFILYSFNSHPFVHGPFALALLLESRHDTHMPCIRTFMICFRIHHALFISLRSRPVFITIRPGFSNNSTKRISSTSYTDPLSSFEFPMILASPWGRTKR